ncbi:hypothetical protein MKX03_020000 [Papaver bracteatum]|nr:hypothetical protein MKX03_020000 [Papaver bracteatum]
MARELIQTLRLATEIDVKNERMGYMEKRLIDLSKSLSRMTEERDHLSRQKCQEIDKCEAQLDLKCKQLSVLSQEVTRKLNTVQEKFDGAKDISSAEDMCRKLEEKDYELDSLISLNTLIAKECRSDHELQEARKVLIEGLDGFAYVRSRPPVVGIKRMGELNEKPLRDICIKKFSSTEWETKSAELCSLWQKKIQDSEWYPYKHVTIDEKLTFEEWLSILCGTCRKL